MFQIFVSFNDGQTVPISRIYKNLEKAISNIDAELEYILCNFPTYYIVEL